MSDETDSPYWHSDEELESAPVLSTLFVEFVERGQKMPFANEPKWKSDAEHLLSAAFLLKEPKKITNEDLHALVKQTMNWADDWAEKLPAEFTTKFDFPYMDFGFEPDWLPMGS